MKKRTLALLLAAVLVLLAGTALAAEGGVPGETEPSIQTEPDAGAEAPPEEEPPEPEIEPRAKDPVQEADGDEDAGEVPVETYIPDSVGSISFANVSRRMHEGNLQILAIQESVDNLEELDYDKLKDNLRDQLNQIANAQWMMVMMGQRGTLAYEQMDQAYSAVRDQFDAIKDGDMQEDNAGTLRQLKSLQNQIVMAGETTYIALAAMELQEDSLERQLAALDRQLTELKLRYELGHISSMTLKQAQSGRTALTSGLSTLRMNLDTYKGQLELLVGADITGGVSLGPLPAVTREELDAMDLEKDLETAKENSWNLYNAAETLKDEREKYIDQGGDAAYEIKKNNQSYKQARHNWNAAQYTYNNTVQNFELSLRNLFLKVKDYKQVLDAAKTALAVEQDNYAVARLKQSQGSLSQNALLEAGDKLKEAQEKVASAENDLFSAYNTYRWAVDYGIMN